MTPGRRIRDIAARALIYFCAFLTTGILVALIVYIMVRGLPNISWDFLTGTYLPGNDDATGIFNMIATTVYIIGLTLLFAAPIGIFAAIYLTEYARAGRLVSLIRFTTESLAGIPSIIFGLFGFMFFGMLLGFKWSLLTGALTLSLTVLPTIIRATEEAIKAVPEPYREGSLALGASKLYTLFKIVLPTAFPGILTSLILSIGRIVGETAAVIFTAGIVYRLPHSIMDSGRTLAVHLYILATEGSTKAQISQSDATAAVLVVLVLLINIASNVIGRAFGKKVQEN
jgi:phosphate transport system permease protein